MSSEPSVPTTPSESPASPAPAASAPIAGGRPNDSRPPFRSPRRFDRAPRDPNVRLRTVLINGVAVEGSFDEILKKFSADSQEVMGEYRFREFHRSKKEKMLRKAQKVKRKR